jgi:quercetin dioxygenase-like cupin family protein
MSSASSLKEMAMTTPKSGEPFDIKPLGPELRQAKTTTLVQTDALKIVRLVVPAGKDIPSHRAPGEITVQCLEGRVAFTAGETTYELGAGQMLNLPGKEPHALRRIEDASLLVTILLR